MCGVVPRTSPSRNKAANLKGQDNGETRNHHQRQGMCELTATKWNRRPILCFRYGESSSAEGASEKCAELEGFDHTKLPT